MYSTTYRTSSSTAEPPRDSRLVGSTDIGFDFQIDVLSIQIPIEMEQERLDRDGRLVIDRRTWRCSSHLGIAGRRRCHGTVHPCRGSTSHPSDKKIDVGITKSVPVVDRTRPHREAYRDTPASLRLPRQAAKQSYADTIGQIGTPYSGQEERK